MNPHLFSQSSIQNPIHTMKITIVSFLILWISTVFVESNDTLTVSDSLFGNETLISENGKFELGFFSRGNPIKYYLGMWYKDIPAQNKIIWVGNRDSPSYSNSAIVKLGNHSNIVLLDNDSEILWQTLNSSGKNKNPIVQLLDSGNLVVREAEDPNPDNFIWQSFDHPTDTLIAGQKLGWNLKTGLNRFLTSWAGQDDPSCGNYTFAVDFRGDPEIYLRHGDQIVYRSGPWVGQQFSGVPDMNSDTQNINFTFYTGSNEVYYTYELPPGDPVISGLMVTYQGFLQRKAWVPQTNQWVTYLYARKDPCDYYRVCGPYGICNVTAMPSFICQCPNGFGPKDPSAWGARNGSGGCVRDTKLDCETDGFVPLQNMKLPETITAYVNKNLNIEQCRDLCRKDCSCTAFADWVLDKGFGSGCVIWNDNLTDMRDFVQGGQTVYLRVSASDIVTASTTPNASNKAKKVAIVVGISTAAGIILTALVTLIRWNCKNRRKLDPRVAGGGVAERSQDIFLHGPIITSRRHYSEEADHSDDHDLDLPLYDVNSMAIATNNFSDANKIGQGGFGRVYKGVMVDGKIVAVKRLSKESGQGAEEFKNEVRLIAKLQHRNLVRLLGCCIELNEKMLIYEYLESGSLDSILFKKERSSSLNWQTRFNIICGIARGLLYLHQDSRYRIIHRDLKASNILLDRDLNPKISDFGMARIFKEDETEGNTRRVVGTYGYMAPEYIMDGIFSIKSDVFSFGVLVIEILSGAKNRGFFNSDQELTLLSYSWKQWREGKAAEMLDKSIGEQCSINEVVGCLQVGLLCVQERPDDRPTMGSVVQMLSSNDSASLPRPKLPGFCMGWNPTETDSSSSNKQYNSVTVNQVTVTTLNSR